MALLGRWFRRETLIEKLLTSECDEAGGAQQSLVRTSRELARKSGSSARSYGCEFLEPPLECEKAATSRRLCSASFSRTLCTWLLTV